MSKRVLTPEQKARKRENLQRWRERNPAKALASSRAYEAKHREKRVARETAPDRVAYRRTQRGRAAARELVGGWAAGAGAGAALGGAAAGVAGFVAAAAPGPGASLLAALTAAAPRCDDRDEIVAEAALLVLESGMAVSDAVATARRRLGMGDRLLYGAVPIEDCVWL